LKRKIKDWKLEKNVKSVEMRYIVRKTQQREAIGKSTIFRVRGQPVDPSKIERWQKRCGEVQLNNDSTSLELLRELQPSASNTETDIIIAAPSTPSDISKDTWFPRLLSYRFWDNLVPFHVLPLHPISRDSYCSTCSWDVLISEPLLFNMLPAYLNIGKI
jgi:hypothetical protein